jgi:hypothetical protein
VLVTTAWSACEETARMLMNVPGNKNPVDFVVSYSTNQNHLRAES